MSAATTTPDPRQRIRALQDPGSGPGLWTLWFAIVAGTVLRILSINSRSLWLDEAISVDQADQVLEKVIATLAAGVHPPLFHITMHYWMQWFGTSEVAIRSYATLWGVLAIPVAYWAGSIFLGKWGATYAALIVAFSPYLIWYSQEARMYSLMFFCAMLSMAAFGQALRKGTWGAWAFYAFATFLGMFTHYFFAFMVVGQGLYYLVNEIVIPWFALRKEGKTIWSPRKPLGIFTDLPQFGRWLSAVAFIGGTFVLWLTKSVFVPSPDGSRVLVSSATGSGLGYGQAAPSLAFRFNDTVLVLSQLTAGFHSSALTFASVAMWPLLVYAALVLLDYVRPGQRMVNAIAWSSVGVLIIMALGQWQGQVLAVRYFAAVTAPVVLLIAYLFQIMRPRRRTFFTFVGLLLCLIAWYDQSWGPENMIRFEDRTALRHIEDSYQRGDLVIYEPMYMEPTIKYYVPSNIPTYGFPVYGQFSKLRNGKAEIGEDLYRIIGPSDRVWLVLAFQDIEQLRGDAYNTYNWFLRNGYRVAERNEYDRIETILFERIDPNSGGYDLLRGE